MEERRTPGKAREGRGAVSTSLGERAEEAGAAFLTSLGFRILERRFRTRSGEIDLIALEGPTLVFVEVKCRTSGTYGGPAEAVDDRKQARLVRAAAIYLARGGDADRACRFDVLEVSGSGGGALRCRLIRDAFEAP